MKRILFTTVSLGVLGLMSPALGADLPTKAPIVATPLYDWSGFYVGVFGGGGFGNHNINVPALGPLGFANFTVNYDSTGAIGGGEVGYNVQSGNIVVGVEADGFWSGIKGSDASQFNNGSLPGGITSIDQTKLRYGGSFRARGGIAIDRLLLFFDGGWATASLAHTDTIPGGAVDAFTVQRSGLAAGGGIAYAITNNLIGKFEYRYYDFGRFTRNNPLNGVLPYTIDNTYSVVTIGFDYEFNFGGPVVAKY
jgi:outer membrane immunogenic protein